MGILGSVIQQAFGVGFNQLDDWIDRMIQDGRDEEAFAVLDSVEESFGTQIAAGEEFLASNNYQSGIALSPENQGLLGGFGEANLGGIENISSIAKSPAAFRLLQNSLQDFQQNNPAAQAQAEIAQTQQLAQRSAAQAETSLTNQGLSGGPRDVFDRVIGGFGASPGGDKIRATDRAQREAIGQDTLARRKEFQVTRRGGQGGESGKGINISINVIADNARALFPEGTMGTFGQDSLTNKTFWVRTPAGVVWERKINEIFAAQPKNAKNGIVAIQQAADAFFRGDLNVDIEALGGQIKGEFGKQEGTKVQSTKQKAGKKILEALGIDPESKEAKILQGEVQPEQSVTSDISEKVTEQFLGGSEGEAPKLEPLDDARQDIVDKMNKVLSGTTPPSKEKRQAWRKLLSSRGIDPRWVPGL